MKERIGRLNIIQFVDPVKVCKIAIVKEEKRPYRLMTEKWALEKAGELGVNTPQVLDYIIDQQRREVLTLKRINGQNIDSLPIDEKCACLYSVGHQMKLLKSPIKGFGWINLDFQCGVNSNWKSFLCSYTEIYGGNMAKVGIISYKDLCLIKKLLLDMQIDNQIPFLVNRDIKAGNIIKDQEGNVWIIDWENTILGDPVYDLAIFGGNYGHGRLWKSLFKGYDLLFSQLKYYIYQAIALFGTIDFCLKYSAPFAPRHERLKKIIYKLEDPEFLNQSILLVND